MASCPLFDRTVTRYRLRDGLVERTVLENCFFQYREEWTETPQGRRQKRPFLLAVPGETVTVAPGDRVLDGEGPQVTPEDWPRFIPALVEGLVQVGCVSPCYLDGQLTHVEAKEASWANWTS